MTNLWTFFSRHPRLTWITSFALAKELQINYWGGDDGENGSEGDDEDSDGDGSGDGVDNGFDDGDDDVDNNDGNDVY